MIHFLFRHVQLGGHVHVHIWAGTPQEAENRARGKLGHLIMDPHDWAALRTLLETGMADVAGAVVEFEHGPQAPESSDEGGWAFSAVPESNLEVYKNYWGRWGRESGDS